MADMYTCASCGALTSEKGHLCNPKPVDDICEVCSEPAETTRHICKPMLGELEFVCESCGRPAVSADLVCKPKKIPGK